MLPVLQPFRPTISHNPKLMAGGFNVFYFHFHDDPKSLSISLKHIEPYSSIPYWTLLNHHWSTVFFTTGLKPPECPHPTPFRSHGEHLPGSTMQRWKNASAETGLRRGGPIAEGTSEWPGHQTAGENGRFWVISRGEMMTERHFTWTMVIIERERGFC